MSYVSANQKRNGIFTITVAILVGRRPVGLDGNASVPSVDLGLFHAEPPQQEQSSRELHLYYPRYIGNSMTSELAYKLSVKDFYI